MLKVVFATLLSLAAQPTAAGEMSGPEPAAEAASLGEVTGRLDDWYYPAEEPGQRAALKMPSVVEIAGNEVTLAAADNTQPLRVKRGGQFDGWRVAETLTEPRPMVVLEREFDRWGLFVYLDMQGVVAEIRKAVGRLDAIREPRVRYPKDYLKQVMAAKEDILGAKALAGGKDPTYQDVAGFLAPLHSYAFFASPESSTKYTVHPNGRIGVHVSSGHQRPTLFARIAFDPCKELPEIAPDNMKRGLLGGWLPAVNYGCFDTQRKAGWELCALMARGPSTTAFARLRTDDGKSTYYQFEPLKRLDDGKPFFAALLELRQSWQTFFDGGMQLEGTDRRTLDVARASIVESLNTYVGNHPKYGLGYYAQEMHDTFPPQTISLATCLLDWGLADAAKTRLGYYLDRFVKPDGTCDYYGTAVAEYGELLDVAAACVRQTGDVQWFTHHRQPIERIIDNLLRMRALGKKSQSPDAVTYGLLHGSPEADNRKQTDYYFSGNAWCWRGLLEIGNLFIELGQRQNDLALAARGRELLSECETLRADILRAADRSIIASHTPPFFPPIAGFDKPFDVMTQDRLASYTNYRYWLETLSAACLPPGQERMMLDYRLTRGGELLGMTRFGQIYLDNWPYWHHARAVLRHDRVERYLLGYYGHMAHHQTQGTFTAYEGVGIPGDDSRRERADYCVPSQLTTPMMTRWMLVFEEPDEGVLWLCRAVPRAWMAGPLAVRGALTRWGPVSLQITPADDLRKMTARIELPTPAKPVVMLRIRHPKQMHLVNCRVEGGRCLQVDAQREVVRLQPEADAMTVELSFGPK